MNRPTLQEKIYAYMEQHEMLREGDRVIAGVSGGADSVCMLLILNALRAVRPFSLQVAHIEHGLRGEDSLEDAAFVEALCRRLEVPCKVLHKDVAGLAAERGLSTEEAGRMIRYEVFEDLCPADGKIAVAHNMQDQAETVLFHLVRGTGMDGLAGIRPVRGKIIRPLLCCSREEIEEWLRSQGQDWRTDATNLETVYSRNLIRHQILPVLQQEVNAQAVRHICEAADRVDEAGRYLDRKALEFMEKHMHVSTELPVEKKTADGVDKKAAAGASVRTGAELSAGAGAELSAGTGAEPSAGAGAEPSVGAGAGISPGTVTAVIDLIPFRSQDTLIQEYILRRTISLVRHGIGLKDLGLIHVRDLVELAYKPSGKRLDLPGRLKAVRRGKQMFLFVEQ